MKNASRAVVAAALILAPALASAGAPVNSPALPGSINSATTLRCVVINTGTKDAEGVTVDIVDTLTGLSAGSVGPATIAARKGKTFDLPPVENATYCRVTGMKKKDTAITYYATDDLGTALMTVTTH